MAATPEATIVQGKLQGSLASDILGQPYYSFQGIPYAKPPIGNLRFKAPQPPEKWTGTFDATKLGSPSYSRDFFNGNGIIGGEDCLVLNVYTKHLPNSGAPKKLLPVMFWIHGGGFIWGSGGTSEYGPDFLITQDVVVVTLNYRLGILGFLSLKDSTLGVPGNAGLKDIVMALKWVKKNINHFGGDPGNVTIFGESAGAAAVHCLTLSPLAKGLFHKGILQSGSTFCDWVMGRQNSDEIASTAGLEGVNEKKLLEFLLKQPVDKLFEIQEKILLSGDHPSLLRAFQTVVENNTEDAFLRDSPLTLMSKGEFNQVPIIIGYTSAEGIFMDSIRTPSYDITVPTILGYQSNSEEVQTLKEFIKNFYYGLGDPSKNNKNVERLQLSTDQSFLIGIYLAVTLLSLKSNKPVYFYKMTIESGLNFFKEKFKIEAPGASHCDDLGYLFKNDITPEIKEGSLEDLGWRRFVKLWTNFAKYGNPTPDSNDPLLKTTWKPVTKNILNYLNIGQQLEADVKSDYNRFSFWKNILLDSPANRNGEFDYLRQMD